MSHKIHDLKSLNGAIADLEAKKQLLEGKLDANGEHLQQNFMSMAYRSIVPKSTFETGPIAAAGNFFKSEKLKDGFTKLVSSFTDMASERVESIVNKFKAKRDDKTV